MVGEVVANFQAMSSSGKEISLSEILKTHQVVLYFYPKDNTPGCTIEGNEFNRFLKDFSQLNTKVYGVSRDSVQSHCRFIDKFGFEFELLSDADEKLCQQFDVIKEKNMYGKKVMGIERSTFIIDQNQTLIQEYRKVKAEGHAENVLNFLKVRAQV